MNVPSLDRIPELYEESKWLWTAWGVLNGKRQYNETGPQPIPISECLAFVIYRSIDATDEREDFLYIITAMDQIFLEHARKARRTAQDKQTRKQVGRGRR